MWERTSDSNTRCFMGESKIEEEGEEDVDNEGIDVVEPATTEADWMICWISWGTKVRNSRKSEEEKEELVIVVVVVVDEWECRSVFTISDIKSHSILLLSSKPRLLVPEWHWNTKANAIRVVKSLVVRNPNLLLFVGSSNWFIKTVRRAVRASRGIMEEAVLFRRSCWRSFSCRVCKAKKRTAAPPASEPAAWPFSCSRWTSYF